MPSANLRTTMCTSVEDHSNCCSYFLRLSGSPDLFLINFRLSLLDFSTILHLSRITKQKFQLAFLHCREIITVKTIILHKLNFFSRKVLQSIKKNLALSLFNCLSQKMRLADSRKFICIDQLRFYGFLNFREDSKMFNITSKKFTIFNKTSPAS